MGCAGLSRWGAAVLAFLGGMDLGLNVPVLC